jgi:NAD(P)-dependent dehydrogenase (short-subunit alcohol dehydrogenase family)
MKANELFDLTGKVAVVTGGMGQLGIEYACALVECGARVALMDMATSPKMNDDRFTSALKRQAIVAFQVDITNRDAVVSTVNQIVEAMGVPHILINNAALDSPPNAPADEVGPFETYPLSSFRKVMDVNVSGMLICCQVIGGLMAEQGRGSIINISSIYGILSPCQDIYDYRRKDGEVFFKPVAYAVSKSAVLNLTRYLATYWAKKGVRVNTLTPAGVFNNQPKEFLANYCARVPMGRMSNPDEMNGAIIFLASSASSYVTGSNLVVDGGWSAW